MSLKELEEIYSVVKQLRSELTYEAFEDLIYDMRHMEYKMLGVMERGRLITYAGVAVQTNLYHKRHLYVFDLVTDSAYRGEGYGKAMLAYLVDFANLSMCENIVLSSGFAREDAHRFYERDGYEKRSFLFVKSLQRD